MTEFVCELCWGSEGVAICCVNHGKRQICHPCWREVGGTKTFLSTGACDVDWDNVVTPVNEMTEGLQEMIEELC